MIINIEGKLIDFNVNHVHIIYYIEKRDKPENLRFLSRDTFGLFDSAAERNNLIEKIDSIVVINDITCDKGFDNNIPEVIKLFVERFSDTIIVSEVTPTVTSFPDADEVYKEIINIDGINDKQYSISNYGNVKWNTINETVPVKMFNDGNRVGLICKDAQIRFYSIPYLITKMFESCSMATDDWETEFIRLCNQFESLGFKSINQYCQFEYAEAVIYPNDLGQIIIDEIPHHIFNKE